MFSLFRNDIENPSYKRGLGLTAAMLIFYGLAFQLHAIEPLAPDTLVYVKYICLALAIVLSFRAMAERRNLHENNESYVSMIDPSVISHRWPIAAIIAAAGNCLMVHLLFGKTAGMSLGDVIAFAAPLGLFILGIGYARAALSWTDEAR